MKDMPFFMKQIGLPAEACRELNRQMELLRSCGGDLLMDRIARDFFAHQSRERYLNSLEEIRDLGLQCQIPEYSIKFLYLMTCGELLEEEYRREGLPEQLFWDTMQDLRFKLQECYDVYKIWGIFVADWYYIFWTKRLFKLGRLEYEIKELTPQAKAHWNIPLEAGSTMHKIHIPSAGPLLPEDVQASLRQAYRFFGYQKPQIAEFVCDSWILCPFNHEIFPENSNLRKFFDLFSILDFHEDDNFADCWRIFSVPWTHDLSSLKQESSLQRAIAGLLADGRKMGEGLGLLRFDGNAVLKP